MKVAVNTIAKNEAENAAGFVRSCAEADLVIVLDTGSIDGTPDLLRAAGACVEVREVHPWRFDIARNLALELVPDDVDIVVSIDLDERLQPGWRAPLEEMWASGIHYVAYRYTAQWRDDEETEPMDVGWRTKVFARHGFTWTRPVHEMPIRTDGAPTKQGYCEQMVVHQHQRGPRDYAPLLSHLLADEPDDAEARQLRGGEHMRNGRWREAQLDYERYLELSGRYVDHPGHVAQGCVQCELIAGRRAYVRIDLARIANRIGTADQALRQLLFAAAEAPFMREVWVYLADVWRALGNWPAVYGASMTALAIVKPGINAQDMVCWGDLPQRFATEAAGHLGLPAGVVEGEGADGR